MLGKQFGDVSNMLVFKGMNWFLEVSTAVQREEIRLKKAVRTMQCQHVKTLMIEARKA